jgi:mannose-6-phosphate isomerase-like protein (cupin superfamily)
MPTAQGKNFGTPDETINFPKCRMDVVKIGNFTVARSTHEPGWDWSEHVKPLTGDDSCQVHHRLILISGRIHVRMNDGTETEFGPGDVVDIPPGHEGWVVGEEQVVSFDIEGVEEFTKPA